MRKLLLGLLLALWIAPAFGQGNPQCPTRPQGDSTNACASTAFVQNAFGLVQGIPTYETKADAAAATIADVPVIYLQGYLAAGDYGAGYWDRSAGSPSHTAYFQSADGAYWSPSLSNPVLRFEMFGGSCGGSGYDNTPAMNKYNSFIGFYGQQRLLLANCLYYFNTAPTAFFLRSPYIEGTGANATVLFRNYNGTAGVGFFQFTAASGVVLSNFEIIVAAGTSDGDVIRFDATTTNGSSGSLLNNITISPSSTDAYDHAIVLDGHKHFQQILTGSVTAPGSGYVDGVYTDVPLTGGTGLEATATITVASGAVTTVVLTNPGYKYEPADVLSASNTNLGGSGSGFQYTVATVGGSTGVRDVTWGSLALFGAKVATLKLYAVAGGISIMGGGMFVAGGTGTNSGGMLLNGPSYLPSSYIYVAMFTFGTSAFDYCTGCVIRASVIQGDITNTANTLNSSVGGSISGSTQNNWINSNYTVN